MADNYKRIINTTAPEALQEALKPYNVTVRKARNGGPQEWVIEGSFSHKGVIDRAASLFNID